MAKGGGFFRKVALLFDREAGQRMEEETAASLARAGALGSEELQAELAKGGRAASRALTKALSEEYNKTMSKARVDFARGLIDEKQFRQLRLEADRTFNRGLVAGMDQLRAAGKSTEAELQTLSRRIRIVGDEGEKWTDKLIAGAKRAAVAVAALFALDRIKAFGAAAVRAFLDAEHSLLRLGAMVEANGGAVGRSAEQLVAFSRRLQQETLFQAGEIEHAMAQLLTYHSISGEMFERTLRVGTDLSSVFGGLTGSVEALARALDDPVAGLAMLSKQGFKFDDSVKAQIKSLVEQNRLLEAQDIILQDLESQVGGVAASMKTGMTGALDDLNKAWIAFKENIGAAMVTTLRADGIVRRTAGAVRWMAEHVDELAALVVNLGSAIAIVGGAMVLGRLVIGLRSATTAFVALRAAIASTWVMLGPAGWFVLGVSALTTFFQAAGASARAAARDVRDFRDSLKGLGREQLMVELAQTSRELAEAQSTYNELWARRAEGGAKLAGEILAAKDALDKAQGRATEVADALNKYDEAVRSLTESGKVSVEHLAKQVAQLRDLKELRGLNAAEAKQLADAEAQLREMVASGTLSVEDEIAALQALRTERAKAAKQVADTVEAEIRLLTRAAELGVLTADGWARAVDIHKGVAAQLAAGNLPLAERVRLTEQLRALEDAGFALPPAPALAGGPQVDTRLQALPQAIDVEGMADAWMEQHRLMLWAVEDTAHGVVRAWEDAFGRIMDEGATAADFLTAIGQGMGAALLGGLASFAQGKVAENVAQAIEKTALGLAAAANPVTAGMAGGLFAAAAEHGAAAAAWGILAGASGAGASSVRGNRGGHGVSAPRDAGLGAAQKAEAPRPVTYITIDGIDPRNPVHQRLVFETTRGAGERLGGSDVYVNGRRQG